MKANLILKTISALALCLLWTVNEAQAQGTFRVAGADSTVSSTVATNAMVALTGGAKIYGITAYNSSATDLYLHIFATNAVPANNTIPTLPPVVIPAGKTGGYDFGTYGWNVRAGVVVANSTTDRTLTNSTASFMVNVTYYNGGF